MKEKLLIIIREKIQVRFEAVKNARDAAQSAANEETKSSAGDKYETGRAMAQNDRDLYARQLIEIEKEIQILDSISLDKAYPACITGALIDCDLGLIFIAISVGFIELEDKKVMVVSALSPLGQALKGKTTKEKLAFRGKNYTIKSIC